MEHTSEIFGIIAKQKGVKVVTAESCTAGLIAATIAMTPGSSAWLDRGFVVYTPEAKNEMLGVNFETIEKCDITSEEVASEMAYGAIKNSKANFALAVTGLAGPSGGTPEIPVGTVCMAWLMNTGRVKVFKSETKHFEGSRNELREHVVEYMLSVAMHIIQENHD